MINVSGMTYLVDFTLFNAYPDTLLGNTELIERFFVPERDEYFFERQKHVFAAVLRFYTHEEELICPPCIPKTIFEVNYYYIGIIYPST